MRGDAYSLTDVYNLLSHHQRISSAQYLTAEDFNQLSDQFEESECQWADNLHLEMSNPYLGDHGELADHITSILNKHALGLKKKCVECKKQIFSLQKHPICLSDTLSAPNVAKHITQRLGTSLEISEVDDPKETHELPYSVIQTNPGLWSTFACRLYLKFSNYFIVDHPTKVLNCKRDEDWKELRMDASDFLFCVDEILREIFKESVPMTTSPREEFIYRVFSACCGMFYILKTEVSPFCLFEKDDGIMLDTRLIETFDTMGERIHVYIRSHFSSAHILNKYQFVNFWMASWKVIKDGDMFTYCL